MSRFATLAVTLVLFAISGPVQAENALEAGQNVIRQQIDAFLNDDADAAYSFATPEIQDRFPDKDVFFAMVKKSYGPVYRPGGFAFSRAKESPDGSIIIQEVLISGRDGKSWSALYQLMRQEDGSFRINGVQMFRDAVSKGI